MLFAIFAVNTMSWKAILLYSVTYSLASMGVFSVMIKMKDYTYEGFNGLARKEPVLAATAAICLLSLAGIPLTGGFFAKYLVLNAAVEQGKWLPLVIFAVIMAAVSAYYYFRLIRSMYFQEGEATLVRSVQGSEKLVLIINAAILILLGVLPGLI
jgi:NADH-quinone oxidoreductase subunit N